MRTNAMIRHTGEVELVSHVMFQSTCDVDISWYPFDRQECKMHFASWTYDVTKIQVTSNQADLSEFSPNPEFFLENFFAEVRQEHDPCCEQPFSTVVYHIQLQRRSLHPVIFYILPGSIVNTCAIFAFLLPADSGEKISLAMSSLVAMMVFLMAVTIDIPPSSVIPLIGRYYISCIILLGINVVLCVVSVKCKHDVNSISERLGYITKIIGRLCLLTPPPKVFVDSKEELPTAWQSTSDHGSEELSVHSGDHVKDVDFECRTLRALERIRSIIQLRVQQERAESEKTSEALFFCLVLDRCFFALLIFATVVLNLEFLLASPHSHSFEYCPYGHGACPPDFDYKKYEQLIESGQGVAGVKLRSQH
ncbi:neuronal acetylcholine receptor subunit alpha-7-like [Macrobrachium nipponense]|uniref:neuronal acetylcholine receptor subunit alpha-7-like n=1 Tax=Macrobrachium nipponense TaxID=159736 RepID=UPI0030C8BBB4